MILPVVLIEWIIQFRVPLVFKRDAFFTDLAQSFVMTIPGAYELSA